MRLIPAALLLASLSSLPAFAAEWSGRVPGDAVDSHLDIDGGKVLVAAGGAASDDVKAAADALMAGLRDGDAAKVVMDAGALGDLSGLDDAAIVEKAGGMPVDRVLIVRVFDAGDGAFSAVVTSYKKDGVALGGFSFGSNETLATKAGGGVSAGAAGAVAAVMRDTSDEHTDAQKAYDERKIWFQGMAAVSAETGAVMNTWTVAYKGKYKESLAGADFYEYVGRDDLAADIKKRKWIRTGIGLTSLGLYGGGMYMLLKDINGEDFYDDYDDCDKHLTDDYEETPAYDDCYEDVEDEEEEAEDQMMASMKTGGIMMGLGTIAVFVPLFIKADTTEQSDRYRMADEFNQDLKSELGLSANTTDVPQQRVRYAVGMQPWVDTSLGGAGIALRVIR